MIYTGRPQEHLRGLAVLMQERLHGNWRCLYLNSPAMVGEMARSLAAVGVDVEAALGRGDLVLTSARDHLLDGRFDVDRMIGILTETLAKAVGAGYRGLWATGDMSWEFGAEKNFSKLLEYEYALGRLFELQPCLSGVCQYHAQSLPTDVVQWGLRTHQAVYINESLTQENPYYAPSNLLTYARPFVSGTQLEAMYARP